MSTNVELNDKALEITQRNSELMEIQKYLNSLNLNLEKLVDERTEKIQQKNKLLVKYSYTNAHDLRGPVARLLGLGEIYRLDTKLNADFVIEKMLAEAKEIDSVVRRINLELNQDVNET